MSIRQHRDVKVRRQIPEAYRRHEGAHDLVRTKYVPEVCPDCTGKGHVYDVQDHGDAPITCPTCEGEGEV